MSLRALLWKDLHREMRGKEALQAGLVLTALFLLVDLFALGSIETHRVATTAIWTPIVFAAGAVAGRAFAAEVDAGTLEWLQVAPVDRVWHGVSRTIVDWTLVALVAAGAMAGIAGLFGLSIPVTAIVAVAAATPGISIAAGLAAALASQARSRDALLPILLVPVLAPVILAGSRATTGALAGASVGDLATAFYLIAGYDLLMAAAAWVIWPVLLEGD